MTRGRGTGNDDTPSGGPARAPRHDETHDGHWAGIDVALRTLLSDARAEDAAAARRRRHWLRAQAEASASFAALCDELAGHGALVTLGTGDGGTRSGRLVTVGVDVLVLEATGGGAVAIASANVTWIRPAAGFEALGTAAEDAGIGAEVGSPSREDRIDLRAVLAAWAEDRLPVRVVAGQHHLTGDLQWVGIDVVAIGLNAPSTSVYVRLSSVAEASLSVSG